MQSLSAAPPFFISSPHCALMSVLQALTTAEAAKAEWVISRAALSAAMQVNVLVTECPPITKRASALTSKATPFWRRMVLEHDADGVNDFLVRLRVGDVRMTDTCDNIAPPWRRPRPARYGASGADFAGVSEPPGRTMSVEVPCARRRPLASTIRASHEMMRRPRPTARPSARTRPESRRSVGRNWPWSQLSHSWRQ